MSAMSYKGYLARPEFSPDDGVFFGKIAGIQDIVTFEGESVAELVRAFHEAVDDYIETCVKIGKEPQRSYSGNLALRVSPELHAKAARAAELAGMSLNQWGEKVVSEALEEA